MTAMLNKNSRAKDAATIGFKIFLGAASFIFLICLYFTLLGLRVDIKDVLRGGNSLGFVIPDLILLASSYLWLRSLIILSYKYLKDRKDWMHVYLPVILISLSILFIN